MTLWIIYDMDPLTFNGESTSKVGQMLEPLQPVELYTSLVSSCYRSNASWISFPQVMVMSIPHSISEITSQQIQN